MVVPGRHSCVSGFGNSGMIVFLETPSGGFKQSATWIALDRDITARNFYVARVLASRPSPLAERLRAEAIRELIANDVMAQFRPMLN